MPAIVSIKPNPNYKPSKEDEAAFEAVKKKGTIAVPYQTALENVRNSKGMYAIEKQKADAPPGAPDLDDMSNGDLKIMMLSLGVKTDKQMRRDSVIALIRRKLEEVNIVDE